MRPLKKYNNDEALSRLMRYCAYQERCHSEVQNKLWDWGFDEEDRGNIIIRLMEEGFLNEERFARAFVRGKFRIKKWGKTKIAYELKKKRISQNLINLAMDEIATDAYKKCITELISKKSSALGSGNKVIKRKKISSYLYRKGYEYEIINELLESHFR